jgi:hypothetical protein
MAVTSFDPRNPQIQGASGKVGQILHGNLEADSQTFKAGQFVYVHASGGITVSADGDLPVMGIALADGTNESSASVTNATIPVQLIGPDDEVLIQVCSASGSLEASNTVCTPGIAYDLQTVSTNLHYIDSSDTSNQKFVYSGPINDAAGAVTYWGRFRPYYAENHATAE